MSQFEIVIATSSIVQALAVLGTLLFIAAQTWSIRRSLSINAHWNRVQALNMISQSLNALNGTTEPEGTGRCVLRFNHFHLIQTMQDEGLLRPEDWASEIEFMRWAIRLPLMDSVWPTCRSMYRPSLVETIERLWREAGEGPTAPLPSTTPALAGGVAASLSPACP